MKKVMITILVLLSLFSICFAQRLGSVLEELGDPFYECYKKCEHFWTAEGYMCLFENCPEIIKQVNKAKTKKEVEVIMDRWTNKCLDKTKSFFNQCVDECREKYGPVADED